MNLLGICKYTMKHMCVNFFCNVLMLPHCLWQFAQGEKWTVLCDALASRLLAAGYTLAATNCYVCAGNIDKTVEIWSHCLSAETEGKPYVDRLQVGFCLSLIIDSI